MQMFGVAAIPYSPLARGALTRPSSAIVTTPRGAADPWACGYAGAGTAEILSRCVSSCLWYTFEADSHGTWSVKEVAEKKGLTMAQVALAWVLSKDGVVAPTVGATSLESLHELIGELC